MSEYCRCTHAKSSHLDVVGPIPCKRCACRGFQPKGVIPTVEKHEWSANIVLPDWGQSVQRMSQPERDRILTRMAKERKA